MIRRLIRLVLTLLFWLTPVSATIADIECAVGEFSVKQSTISVPHALARVFKTGKIRPSDYVGTAFVIDAKQGLLLTARHVIQDAIPGDSIAADDRVDLSFPVIDGGRIKKARVVDTFDPSASIAPEDREDHNRDLALLQIDNTDLPAGLGQLRIAFMLPALPAEAEVHSYFGASLTPVTSKGEISRPSHYLNAMRETQCTFTFSGMTDGGDSGAPVITPEGFVIGVVLQDIPKGRDGNKIARALPSNCLRNDLVEKFRELLPDRSKRIASDLLREPKNKLTQRLHLNPNGKDNISNLELFVGLITLGEILSKDPDKTLTSQFTWDKYICPIKPAVYERRIYPLPKKTDKSFSTYVASASQARGQADELLDKALKMEQAGMWTQAITLAEASRVLYELDANELGLEKFSVFNRSWISPTSPEKSTQLAQTFKGLSDSQLLIANAILREGTIDPNPAFQEAQLAALSAIRFAPEDQIELRGQAFANYATAAVNLDQFQEAIEGFAFAANNGVSTSWTKKSYDFAYRLRENNLSVIVTKEYLPPDKYLKAAGIDPAKAETDFLIARRNEFFHRAAINVLPTSPAIYK